jgi:hypothetical protein
LERQIEGKFRVKMQNDSVALLKDFETYKQSLPVRQKNKGEYAELYKHDYYARDEDMTTMVKAIEKVLAENRPVVKYISAPSKSGKTSSVLPAFLKSENSSCYLYLAFANNKGRNFELLNKDITTKNLDIAERQGAAFMVECVKQLLDELPVEDCYQCIPLSDSVYDKIEIYIDELQNYLNKKLGDDAVIWFHVDEHRKMCNREYNPRGGAAFSRGALSVLARIKNANVIASYVEPLTTLKPMDPIGISSEVCRMPIPLPAIDVDEVMEKVDELKISKTMLQSDAELHRLYASLKVRLGFKIMELGPSYVLKYKDEVDEVKVFLHNFSKAAKVCNSEESTKADLKDALKQCNKLCGINMGIASFNFKYASKLLLGVNDDDAWVSKQRLRAGIVVLPPLPGENVGQLTASILQLLQMDVPDDSAHPYNVGRDLFRSAVSVISNPTKVPHVPNYTLSKVRNSLCDSDVLVNTPLEASYYWALSVRAKVHKKIQFIPNDSETAFGIKCKTLKRGILFSCSTNSSEYDFNFLKSKDAKTTIFYADKKYNGIDTHPLADMLFLSDDNQLVLVDITGSGDKESTYHKLEKLSAWISKPKDNIPYKLRGVVLAPNYNEERSKTFEDGTLLVCGDDAIILLGGLRQIRRWMD